jgi:hypothetical protein
VNHATQGFFIYRKPHSTKAQLNTFYSEDFGRLDLVAFTSKKQTAFIPFGLYDLEFTITPKFGHGTLKHATPLDPTDATDLDPRYLAIRYFMCDVVNQSTVYKQKDHEAFNILVSLKQELRNSHDIYIYPCTFLAQWMKPLGILPEPVVTADFFDIHEGVFLNKGIATSNSGAKSFNELLNQKNIAEKASIKPTLDLMLQYLEVHLSNFNVNKTRTIIHELFH